MASPSPREGERLGGADALLLLLLLPAQESRPARLERFLHVHVRAGELAPPLQDLGVLAVALEQPLAHAQRLEPANRGGELAVGLTRVAAAVGDLAEPDVRLRNRRTLLEGLGQIERLRGHLLSADQVA